MIIENDVCDVFPVMSALDQKKKSGMRAETSFTEG